MEQTNSSTRRRAKEQNELLRSLPSVSALLEHEEVAEWLHGLPRSSVVAAIQETIEEFRQGLMSGRVDRPVEIADIVACAEEKLADRSTPSLRPVINATGIVLHTGLGRAPLCDTALEAIADGASGYANLEYDLATGERGRRVDHVNALLCDLTGAAAATVVNNNAAATFLILRVLAAGKESIVSRGQLIEIGGSFRLPEIMAASGTTLCEVGTTNRTRLSDYEKAVNERTAVLLRVHTSNYRIVGFTEEVAIGDLAELAHRLGLIAVDDLGSGALIDSVALGLPPEPSIIASLQAGADLVCCSGDKLLGGPQCGLILGKKDLVQRIESDPLMRTYRVDKMTLLALEATLREYLDPQGAVQNIPTLAMLQADTEVLAARAQKLLDQLQRTLPNESFYVGSDTSFAGGGSMPGCELETIVIRWQPATMTVDAMMAALRRADRPVIARVREEAVCLDLRTIRESDFDDLVDSIFAAVHGEDDEEQDGKACIRLPIL